MKKRWLSAALCTAMVAGSLAGCGLKSPETTTTAAATEAAKEEATTAAEAKEESKGCLLYTSTQKDDVGTALVGVRNEQEARENCAAFDWELTDQEIQLLDDEIKRLGI